MPGAQNLFARAANGAGTIDQLTTTAYGQVPSSMTPDGTHVVGYQVGQKTQRDITLVALATPASRSGTGPSSGASPPQVEPLVQTPFNEWNADRWGRMAMVRAVVRRRLIK